MLQEGKSLPTFGSRLDGKLRRLWMAGLRKVTPKKQPGSERFQNAVAWCIHGELATRVVFFNYFWRNHHEERVRLDIQLFSAEGRELWRESRLVSQDETLVIDSAEIACAIGKEQFEGYLAFSTFLSRVPEHIELIRFNVDYYTVDGLISSVHDQAIFAPASPAIHHSLGKMEVVETKDIGTSLIFMNSLSYDAVPIVANVEVKRHDGASIHVGSYVLQSKCMLRIELGKTQPDLEKFLEGKSGQVVVESDFYIKRAAVVQYSKKKLSSWYSVNHSEEYRGNPPYLTKSISVPAIDGRDGPMAPMPFFYNYRNMNTEFVLFHDVPAAGSEQVYGLCLFDNEGKQIFRHNQILTVPLHGAGRIVLKDYLPADQSVFGLAQIFLSEAPNNAVWESNFPADVHYIIGAGEWDAMYSQGSYNSLNAGEGMRARVFGRVYHNEQFKTELIFIHPSTALDSEKMISESCTQVTLCDPTGKITITRELRLKPFSTILLNLSELFPEIESFGLKPGMACGVYVRDVKVKIIVVHLTRNKGNTSIAADHFYGG